MKYEKGWLMYVIWFSFIHTENLPRPNFQVNGKWCMAFQTGGMYMHF